MSTHNLCFEQKYEKYQNFYLKTFSFWWWNFKYIWIGVFCNGDLCHHSIIIRKYITLLPVVSYLFIALILLRFISQKLSPLYRMAEKIPGPSCSKLNEFIKGHFVNCFSRFNIQYANIFCWKNVSSKSYSHLFSKKYQYICVLLDVNFNKSLTNDIVSFEQLGPDVSIIISKSKNMSLF